MKRILSAALISMGCTERLSDALPDSLSGDDAAYNEICGTSITEALHSVLWEAEPVEYTGQLNAYWEEITEGDFTMSYDFYVNADYPEAGWIELHSDSSFLSNNLAELDLMHTLWTQARPGELDEVAQSTLYFFPDDWKEGDYYDVAHLELEGYVCSYETEDVPGEAYEWLGQNAYETEASLLWNGATKYRLGLDRHFVNFVYQISNLSLAEGVILGQCNITPQYVFACAQTYEGCDEVSSGFELFHGSGPCEMEVYQGCAYRSEYSMQDYASDPECELLGTITDWESHWDF